MCILSFYKPGIRIDPDALRDGAMANPHGHGYAVVAGDRVLVGKGLHIEPVIDEFLSARAQFPDQPALFHSRLATHGYVDTDNCHPFTLGGDKRTVLAHNGILPEIVHPRAGDLRSDTRIAAEDLLPLEPFGPLDSWAGRSRLEQWLGTDKMVLLTVDPRYKHNAYLFNEHRGHWSPDGIWYSNTSYLWRYSQSALDAGGYVFEGCDYCGADELDHDGPHCPACGFCQDCWREFPHCTCAELDGTDRYADLDFTTIA